MRKPLIALLASVMLLAGCGEPKTYKMNRMHAVNPMGTFYAEGTIAGVNAAVTELKMGEVTFSNLTLQDETGSYTFYFDPSAQTRQPTVGDHAKLHARFVSLSKDSLAGGGRAPVIEKFEFQ